eukprot:366225-Chlamydomonas_euryale.AAC.3
MASLRLTPCGPCPTPCGPCPMPRRPCPTPHGPCPTPRRPCPTPHGPCPKPRRPCPTPRRPCPTSCRPCPMPCHPCPTPRALHGALGEAADVSGIPDADIKSSIKHLLKHLGLRKGSKVGGGEAARRRGIGTAWDWVSWGPPLHVFLSRFHADAFKFKTNSS